MQGFKKVQVQNASGRQSDVVIFERMLMIKHMIQNTSGV